MIGLFDCGKNLGANSRCVVTCELVMFPAVHVDLANRVCRVRQTAMTKKLPDGPEPQGLQGPPDKSL